MRNKYPQNCAAKFLPKSHPALELTFGLIAGAALFRLIYPATLTFK